MRSREKSGIDVLRDLVNRGTAFSSDERDRLGITGLLPPRIETPDEQVARVRARMYLP